MEDLKHIFPLYNENGEIDEDRFNLMAEMINRYTPPINPEAYFREQNIINDDENYNGRNPFLNWEERFLLGPTTIRAFNAEPGIFTQHEETTSELQVPEFSGGFFMASSSSETTLEPQVPEFSGGFFMASSSTSEASPEPQEFQDGIPPELPTTME